MAARYLILLHLLFLPLGAYAEGGDHIGNGGGLSESRLSFAAITIESLLKHCALTPACGLEDSEKTIIEAIAGQVHNLPADQWLDISYENAGANAQLFKTTQTIGAAVKINRDLIYPLDTVLNRTRALKSTEASAVLVEILLFQDCQSTSIQKTISKKISTALSKGSKTVTLSFVGMPEISAETLRFDDTSASVLISGEDSSAEVGSLMLGSMQSHLQSAVSGYSERSECDSHLSEFKLKWEDRLLLSAEKLPSGEFFEFQVAQISFSGNYGKCHCSGTVAIPVVRSSSGGMTLKPGTQFKVRNDVCAK